MTTMTAEPPAATNPPLVTDARWPRIVARDRAADGVFWYSVATTGIYCRPSCASRTANPRNVTIHGTLAEARASGCRPCLRCRPDDADPDAVNMARIAAACHTIAASEETPRLGRLAAAAGLSPGHFHRLFRAATGVTPRGYAAALRAERLRTVAARGPSTTAALLDAGYGAAGRDYAEATAALGMSPRTARAGGAGETLAIAFGASSLGTVLVATSARGVAAILLGDAADALRAELRARFPAAHVTEDGEAHAAVVTQVIAFVDTPTAPALPLDIRGTLFQQRVWAALRAIPHGTTLSYAELAHRIGRPGAARAVAAACAANAHAVAIPCHRIVRGDGQLAGYRWGIARKRALLARERDDGRPDALAL